MGQKHEALHRLEKGVKPSVLAKELGITKNTISRWTKQKEDILNEYESSMVDPKRKRFRGGKYSDIEVALITWFKEVRSRDNPVPIDGKTLKMQAEK